MRKPKLVVLSIFIVLVVSLLSLRMGLKYTEQSGQEQIVKKLDTTQQSTAATTYDKNEEYWSQVYHEEARKAWQ